jgi:hypothetical protein
MARRVEGSSYCLRPCDYSTFQRMMTCLSPSSRDMVRVLWVVRSWSGGGWGNKFGSRGPEREQWRDDYRTAGKMRGTRTRARRGRAQIATNSESQARSSHPQPHAHGTAMGTARAPSWPDPTPTPKPGPPRRESSSHTLSCVTLRLGTLALLRVLCSCDVVLCCGLSRRVVTGNSTGTPGILGHTVSSIISCPNLYKPGGATARGARCAEHIHIRGSARVIRKERNMVCRSSGINDRTRLYTIHEKIVNVLLGMLR